MKGKHLKIKEKKKFLKGVLLILIIFVLILLGFVLYENLDIGQEDKREEIINTSDEITTKNEKLVLKSNFEDDKEKKIIYIFQDNILIEVRVLEIYNNTDDYNIQKENNAKKMNIEVIESNDNELKISYKRLNLESDEGLSYDEIYSKYMGIIGAYEVVYE